MAALNALILKTIDSPLLAELNSTVIKALEGSMGLPVSQPLVGILDTGSPVTSSVGTMSFPRTTDLDFRSLYPCEIILSHIPIPALGKDKNEQPHVDHTQAARRCVTSSLC